MILFCIKNPLVYKWSAKVCPYNQVCNKYLYFFLKKFYNPLKNSLKIAQTYYGLLINGQKKGVCGILAHEFNAIRALALH